MISFEHFMNDVLEVYGIDTKEEQDKSEKWNLTEQFRNLCNQMSLLKI